LSIILLYLSSHVRSASVQVPCTIRASSSNMLAFRAAVAMAASLLYPLRPKKKFTSIHQRIKAVGDAALSPAIPSLCPGRRC
jgi:hypothetical protein